MYAHSTSTWIMKNGLPTMTRLIRTENGDEREIEVIDLTAEDSGEEDGFNGIVRGGPCSHDLLAATPTSQITRIVNGAYGNIPMPAPGLAQPDIGLVPVGHAPLFQPTITITTTSATPAAMAANASANLVTTEPPNTLRTATSMEEIDLCSPPVGHTNAISMTDLMTPKSNSRGGPVTRAAAGKKRAAAQLETTTSDSDLVLRKVTKKRKTKAVVVEEDFVTCNPDNIPKVTDPARIPQTCDVDGHFCIHINSDLTRRYQIVQILGQGTFGKVVKCIDNQTGKYCAVKVIRAVQKYRDASRVEIRVLERLKKMDPDGRNHCIQLLRCFDWCNHICMVFELLSQSIFDYLKDNGYHPFPLAHVQKFAKQLLEAVAYMHSLGMIHTDLKPENIMLLSNDSYTVTSNKKSVRRLKNTDVKLIDFGSAIFEHDYHSNVVSTRHYRAPEIILGLGWSYGCDMWSIGCILVELVTGQALFQTHDNLEHLALMEKILGPFPGSMTRGATGDAKQWFNGTSVKYPAADTKKESIAFVKKAKKVQHLVPNSTIADRQFLDLVKQLLAYNPSQRISAAEALKHPFFSLSLS